MEASKHGECIPSNLIHPLLRLPAEQALVSHRGLGGWWPWCVDADVYAYDVSRGERLAGSATVHDALLAPSFITVPVRYRGETVGRLYLTAMRPAAFDPTDVSFLLQVFEHTMPSLDNIRLVDRLASDAAEAERQRIARDLHDSIIQPYIGLQLGLAAVRQKLIAGRTEVQADVERLLELTILGITDLRRYVHGLKGGGEPEDGLLPAVRRYTRKFAEATGLTVQVDAAADMRLNDRLAAEVFQMVVEGLSNVRRHTTSVWAAVHLSCHAGHLALCIENAASGEAPPVSFTPRSLTERAMALGGDVEVTRSAEGTTTVSVTIPL
jgi:signal transduction histidine kinase